MASRPTENSLPRPYRSGTALVIVLLAVAVSLSTPARSQNFTVIHNFSGGLDGGAPLSGVTLDRSGNLVGTASEGGSANHGAVYKLTRNGSSWTANALHEFTGVEDGAMPWARVILGPDGTLYGTAYAGGSNNNCGEFTGCGTVFQLRPRASICKSVLCPWIETILYRFPGGASGALPATGDLLFDAQGNLYGTTESGGTHNAGTVYKLTRSGGTWVQSVIYSFTGLQDGAAPVVGVIMDAAGNLYGTTAVRGSNNGDAIYELSPSGSGWTAKTLHAMNPAVDGCFMQAGLIFDSAGNLYGPAAACGPNRSGTVFELAASGGSRNVTVLYDDFGDDGGYESPAASLSMDRSGALYGTAVGWNDGGDYGRVFKLTPTSNGWVYTGLHQFDVTNGDLCFGGVTLDASGNLYRTTFEGAQGGGTVWMLTQ